MHDFKRKFSFWENIIQKRDSIFMDESGEKRITKKSIIMYIGMFDEEKDVLRGGWSSWEGIDYILGFLQHVFIPTSYLTLVDRECDGVFVPVSPFEILKAEVMKYVNNDEVDRKREALGLEREYYYLNHLWKYDDDIKMEKIKEFCDGFNIKWNKEPSKRLFIKIINECSKIPDEIIEGDQFLEVIEEEIEMPFEQFRNMCDSVYKEPFINRRFLSLLNTKLPILF